MAAFELKPINVLVREGLLASIGYIVDSVWRHRGWSLSGDIRDSMYFVERAWSRESVYTVESELRPSVDCSVDRDAPSPHPSPLF